MASSAAHRSTGWAVGVLAAAIVSARITDDYRVWTILTCLAGYAGGTAPDWLENAWWSPGPGKRLWITHRTWTHWGLAWIALLVTSYYNLQAQPFAAPVFGFAAGGLMHLVADWPNPLGVPWLLTKRYSLRWWKSGRCDGLIIVCAWIAAVTVADTTWWHDTLHLKVSVSIREMIASLPPSHVAMLTRWFYPFA